MKEEDWLGVLKWIIGLIVALITAIGSFFIADREYFKQEARQNTAQLIELNKLYSGLIERNTKAYIELTNAIQNSNNKKGETYNNGNSK